MAKHLLWSPEQAAKSTLAALRHLSLTPRTVRQDFSSEFFGGRGQTVNILKPISAGKANVYTPANRASRDGIKFNELSQEWIPVKIEDQLYNAVKLPDDWATFTLESLEKQVLVPQAISVVDRLAEPLIAQMVAIETDEWIPKATPDGKNVRKILIEARKVLNKRKVTTFGRTVLVGAGLEAAFLADELLQKVNESGTSSVLREASIGNLFGFNIIADPSLPDDFGIAFHEDAFAHITRVARAPEGAPFSATVAQDGFTLRWIQQYDTLHLEDQSVVDTFFAGATLDADRAVSFGLSEKVEPESGS